MTLSLAQLANAVTIAQALNSLTDDETATFDGLLATATTPDKFVGQLERFVNTQAEAKVVVSLFTKIAACYKMTAAT